MIKRHRNYSHQMNTLTNLFFFYIYIYNYYHFSPSLQLRVDELGSHIIKMKSHFLTAEGSTLHLQVKKITQNEGKCIKVSSKK